MGGGRVLVVLLWRKHAAVPVRSGANPSYNEVLSHIECRGPCCAAYAHDVATLPLSSTDSTRLRLRVGRSLPPNGVK